MKEKDIKITTLTDDKLQILSPPTSIYQFDKNSHQSPNESKNTVIYGNKGGFTYLSKVEYLGSGGFSKVYKYRGDLENKAVKKIMADPKYYSKSLTAEDSIKREVYGMTKVDCNHSLKVYGVYQNTDKNIFYILMEQCDGNIEDYMKKRGYPLNINEIILLLSQLNEAFYLLNTNNIIHRDLKPSNILYKEDKNINQHNKRTNKKIFEGKNLTFKLGDYGICIPLYDKEFSKSQFMGTLDYMAPEIYEMKCEKEHPVFTKKIDLFSLGQSILWLMGFFEKANALTTKAVEDLRTNCKLFEGNHKEKLLADLIFNHLLVFDPNKRDGWEEYFNHPLFEEYGVICKEYNNYTDGNSQRIKKRVIKRNNLELVTKSKLFNSEKKIDINNKIKMKINKEENIKTNINKKNIPVYKYKINPNVEKRPFINSSVYTNNKNISVISTKNSDEKPKINEQNKFDISISNIEKKKTFDYQRNNFSDNKNNKIPRDNKKVNQIKIISCDLFGEKEQDKTFGRNSINGTNVKNYIEDVNSHFISVRNKYKRMSQTKNNNDISKKLVKKIELNIKKEPKEPKDIKLKQSSSFSKDNKIKEEETKNDNNNKYSKSHKKYNYFKSNINLIEKKNTIIKNIKFEQNKNQILNNNDINNNINPKEQNNRYNNIKITNYNYNTYKNKNYSSIKVINHRIEENKKNKNIGFYFSKYSTVTKKD